MHSLLQRIELRLDRLNEQVLTQLYAIAFVLQHGESVFQGATFVDNLF